MSSKAELLWAKGITLESLLRALEDYGAGRGIGLGPSIGGTEEKPYVIGWLGRLEPTRRPWELRPLVSPAFHRLDWTLVSGEREWFRCAIFVDSDPPPINRTCVRGGEVIRLAMCFDEEPDSWSLSQEEAERAAQKYHQIYELYKLLECDEVNGYSDSHYSAGTALDKDPEHVQKIFRFARTGRNIHNIPLEEGRARHVGEHVWRKVMDA